MSTVDWRSKSAVVVVLLSGCVFAAACLGQARPRAVAQAYWAPSVGRALPSAALPPCLPALAQSAASSAAALAAGAAGPASGLLGEGAPLDARGFPRKRKAAATPRHPDELSFEEMTFKLPPMERVMLGNGLRVILIHRPELPVFAMDLAIKMCDACLPENKRGLSSVCASVWRSGGTVKRPAEELDNLVETLGGSLSIYATSEYTGMSLKFLSRDMETAIDIMADLLLNPAFPEDGLELVKSQKLDSIKRQHEDPATVASLAADLVLYGSHHPYGRLMDEAELSSFTRRDLMTFHAEFVRPNNAVLAVAGDFDRDVVLDLLRKHLVSWKVKPVSFPPVPPQAVPNPGVITLLPSEGGDCFVRLVEPVQSKSLRGRPVTNVANVIMGYYRLMARLRMQEGLAFNPYTWFELRDHGGGFGVDFECAPSDLCKAIDVTREVLDEVRSRGVSEEELQHGKDFYLNSAPFEYDSAEEVASLHSWLELRGRPMDYYMRRFKKLQAMTAEDVDGMVGRYVHPDRLAMVVVGPLSEIDCDLSKYGPVRRLERVEDLK